MSKNEKPKTWGGAREGAGRKSRDLVPVSARIPRELRVRLSVYAKSHDTPMSRVVSQALENFLDRE
jgi:hypothetical protein